jgi:hypothetical protein
MGYYFNRGKNQACAPHEYSAPHFGQVRGLTGWQVHPHSITRCQHCG